MRLVQFLQDGEKFLGLELEKSGDIINLNAADASIPRDMRIFIEGGADVLERTLSASNRKDCLVMRDRIRLLAPITSCEKVLCIGMNYRDHCKELNFPIPTEPVVFNKFPSCVIGPDDSLKYPGYTEVLDWEAELAIVIGKTAKYIQVKYAMEYVFGFTVANDVTARDWMKKNGGQAVLGKARDQFCPLGPSILTKDEINDPHNLRISCKVNGNLKQDSNTNQLIHKTEQIIAYISRFITLKPGDLILTGSPPGVGYCRTPPESLKIGDVVEVAIEHIGTITTKII